MQLSRAQTTGHSRQGYVYFVISKEDAFSVVYGERKGSAWPTRRPMCEFRVILRTFITRSGHCQTSAVVLYEVDPEIKAKIYLDYTLPRIIYKSRLVKH